MLIQFQEIITVIKWWELSQQAQNDVVPAKQEEPYAVYFQWIIGDDMKIIIEYESSWRNSFRWKPVMMSNYQNKGRNFVASGVQEVKIAQIFIREKLPQIPWWNFKYRLVVTNENSINQGNRKVLLCGYGKSNSFQDNSKYNQIEMVYLRNIESDDKKVA